MKKTWHSGPPPSIGWWPASRGRQSNSFRWWNGHFWSDAAFSGLSLEAVARVSTIKAFSQERIEWTHRPKSWPARSRT